MLVAILSLLTLLADAPSPADLTGKVVGFGGEAIPLASIAVSSAAPKKEKDAQGSADHPDCAKSATSDDQGAFNIPQVDLSLNYDLLVLADGYRPLMLRKVDPARGQINAKLAKLPENLEADKTIKGRILDGDGKPVAGASVEAFGYRVGQQTWYGGPDIEKQTWSDSKGEFVLISKRSDMTAYLRINGGNVAPMVTTANTGEQLNDIAMTVGATVTGRLTKDGQPLGGVAMKIAQEDRSWEKFVGEATAITGEDGKFKFSHVAPDTRHQIYTPIKSLGDKGAVPITACAVEGDNTTQDAGEIVVEPGYTVSGKVFSSDDKPLRPGLRFSLSRQNVGDSINVNVDKDGKFEVKCVPGESMTLSLNSNDYHFSEDNQSFSPPHNALLGMVNGESTDLNIKLEPGQPQNDRLSFNNSWQQLLNEPLRGVSAP